MAAEDPDEVRRSVGRRIAELRLARGCTQEAVAEQLGMQLKNYQRIERGRQNMTIRTLVRIAGALEVKTIELFEPPVTREVKRGRPRKQAPAGGM